MRKTIRCLLRLVVLALGCTLLRGQTGSISADPNPCEIYLIENLCTSRLTWTSSGTTQVQVWVQGSGDEVLWATTGSGPRFKDATWIQDHEVVGNYAFRLWDYSSGSRGALLGSVTVHGIRIVRCRPLE
jgi:hypothetical protein